MFLVLSARKSDIEPFYKVVPCLLSNINLPVFKEVARPALFKIFSAVSMSIRSVPIVY
jgi:hypothetical protein